MFIDLLTVFVPAAVILSLILSVIATRRVRGDIGFTADQRAVQIWLIWLLPVVGAAFVLAALQDEPGSSDVKKERTAQEHNKLA